jgi:sugar fermentation stimulation protein A
VKKSMGSTENAVCYPFPAPLVSGRLIRRYKRFLADVTLDEDGRTVTVHCPNSGSMLGALEQGAPVMLSPSDNPNRRTAYTWRMIYIDGHWVGIDTTVPNRLVEEAARQRALSIFAGVSGVRREVKIGDRTRIDLVAESAGGPLYVEVKNVTLVRNGVAHFPDAVTERGARHLEELRAVVERDGAAATVYLVQRRDAEAFGPADDIDSAYGEAYRRARTAGMAVCAAEAEVTPERVCLRRELPLLI